MHAISPKTRKPRKPRGQAIRQRIAGPRPGLRSIGDEYLFDAYVGQRIRARRSELGMSQSKLAAELGLTFQQVQKYERGSNRVGAGRLYRLTHILSVPVTYFYDGLATARADADAPPLDRSAYTTARLLARLDPRKKRAAIALLSAIAGAKREAAHG